MTVKVLDFVCGGRESGHEFGVGVPAEEGVSVPEDGGGGTVEAGEDGTLGVELFVEYLGEIFGAYEGGVRRGRLWLEGVWVGMGPLAVRLIVVLRSDDISGMRRNRECRNNVLHNGMK